MNNKYQDTSGRDLVLEALIQTRSILRTAIDDKPEDLTEVRRRVIARQMALLDAAIKSLGH